MNDAERWRIVADWFDEAARTGEFGLQTRCGLCYSLWVAQGGPRPCGNRYVSPAHGIVTSMVGFHDHDYRTRRGAGWRACLALLLAHDAEDHGGNHPEEPTP